MDIRIIKQKVTYCAICDEVRELRDEWNKEQELLVENGEQEEAKPFEGVLGYKIKDADDYRYGTNEICEKCMSAIIKGVGLINSQKLSGISINTDR